MSWLVAIVRNSLAGGWRERRRHPGDKADLEAIYMAIAPTNII
jgi:hypothetical protein